MSNRGIIVSLALGVLIITEGACLENLPLGGAINVLKGYGHLARSINVIRTNMSEKVIYREPIVHVFTIPSVYLSITADVRTVVLMAHVRTVYCPNVKALLAEYFHRFDFEGIDQTASVFKKNWSPAVVASHFGIKEAFVGNGHCYMFLQVTLSKTHRAMLFPTRYFEIDELVANNAETVIAGDPVSTEEFISRVGTHYISSFVTGDSLYQVFVFHGKSCRQQEITEQLWLRGKAATPVLHDKSVYVSKIRAASGNSTVERWAKENLVSQSGGYKGPSTLEILRTNYALNEQLDKVLQDEALLEMKLETLAPVFKSVGIRRWFKEYLLKRLETSAALLPTNESVL